MMRSRFTMSLLQRLAKADISCPIRSHSHRSLFSISFRCFDPSLLGLQGQADKYFIMLQWQQHYAYFSSLVRKDNENKNQVKIEVIATDHIKPAAPTPKHLRTYQLSLFDQIAPPIYMPFVYFYSNDLRNNSKVIDLLKRSLSETLTRFYPLAGKIKDYRHIDCNDDGVYCVEAKVSQSIFEFLSQPGNKCVQPLLPFEFNPMDLLSKTYVLMIQLTTFSCGGISIGLCALHKIIDGYSYATFLKAWAATAVGEEEICPQFVSPSIFSSTPNIPESMSYICVHVSLRKTRKKHDKEICISCFISHTIKKERRCEPRISCKRAYLEVRDQGLKSSINAYDSIKKRSCLMIVVNLRERSSPPMPSYSIGNIFSSCRDSQCLEDVDIGLESLVRRLKNSIDKIDGDYVEAMKGQNGSQKVREMLNERKMLYSNENTEHLFTTSMCNSGMSEIDFGWGKPRWVSFVSVGDNADPNHVLTNHVLLMDTRSGNGIEAWVTLSNEDMAIFERDPEMLEMAVVDPSPLD